MPILLLPEMAAALAKLGAQMSRWDRLARIEEQLLRRARAAFLVHWFGTAIPTRGINLLIFLNNLDELRERYRLVDRSRRRRETRLNLFAPLAATVAIAAGLLFNPTGGTLLGTAIREASGLFAHGGILSLILEILYRIVYDHLLWPEMTTFFGLLILAVAPPLLLTMGLSAGLGGNPALVAGYELLGALAMMIDAFLNFWRQITGPVDKIRNPLVKAIVQLLHRVAALFIQLAGFVAIVVVRLVPILPWLVAQFRAVADVGTTVGDIASQIVSGILEAVQAPFEANGGILATLLFVLDRIMGLPSVLIEIMTQTFQDSAATLASVFASMAARAGAFVEGLQRGIVDLFASTPVGELYGRIQTLLELMPRVRLAFDTIPPAPPPPPPPPEPGLLRRIGGGIVDAAVGAADRLLLNRILHQLDMTKFAVGILRVPTAPTVAIPSLPRFPSLPASAAIDARVGVPAPVDLGATRDALMEEARRRAASAPLPPALLRNPPSAFSNERFLLRAVGDPVVTARAAQLRDLIYAAVGRVLPPALRLHAPQVRAMFDRIDQQIYGGPRAPDPPAEFPELDLQDSGRLRTQIQTLTIRSEGGFAADLRAFQSMVVEALQGQTYYAAGAG